MKEFNLAIKDDKLYYALNNKYLECELKIGDILQLKDNLSYMYIINNIDIKSGILSTNLIKTENNRRYKSNEKINISVSEANGSHFKFLLKKGQKIYTYDDILNFRK